MATQFSSLLQCVSYFHHQLDEVLVLHQKALIAQKFTLAERILNLFHRALKSHIETEEKYLIPAHDTLTVEKRWHTHIYTDEHAKLLSLLEKTIQRMQNKPSIETAARWATQLIDHGIQEVAGVSERMSALLEDVKPQTNGDIALVAYYPAETVDSFIGECFPYVELLNC